ncbi:PREDICTED: superoxide dismutase [Cu-Zn] 1-like isoform X3 [Amphimedon queenslandica]|uniref:Superoxide dismutase [Cu-Zn] n=1 Tax=Amphimedon queenslandica TaxID=400682 RepID=A0AAN0JFV8_AMPQE|nr:PREDICTED: superoxide dismutase [Cu-Zn] 1-like isoform X3 [Amphimedon queenslandica]|eukprot:XP_019855925.1 PREDICTED: superoxide dismutase [Cu-Zn] 1-like isoform X3 [Amphimedon queenslandica]
MAVDKAKFETSPPVARAVCILASSDDVKGTIEFIQNEQGITKVTGKVTSLAPGDHGFHIHQFGDYTSGCVSAGSHFNPAGKNHGGPRDGERHAGDLGNITSTGGDTKIELYDDQIPLTGPNSIIGRSVVVHADPDDLGKDGHPDSLTTGHAGARLACGVIGSTKLQ